jgi:hypothetical protein
LTVTDDGGASDSTTQVISVTSAAGDPTTLHVQSVVTGTENAGRGDKRGTAAITILDNLGSPVDGATVSVTFSGTFNESVSGQTGPDGTATVKTPDTAHGSVTVNACVDNVMHDTLAYDPGENVVSCSGGNQ